ncbi:RNA polymerase factor sigma-54 [Herbivorax sp. ANBcel31]|uniref:RNA polymerase factor sigma-54 n=1 Tax=Herbivorax sp. ANBcel31 TaxID=3069754 RepID=UPI0027ADCA5D|nr:RNA polymerase factor sigma-54 [Herbivorax sp. ANBcel31]MDQ2085012.1 RNA polymerase factor sigma-54 [Herbivorax sp. ANBcel31]
MDFYFDLDLIKSQKVILTPQLKQALEILKMNSQELTEYIQNEIETNPALDICPDCPDTQEHVCPLTLETKEYFEKNDEIIDFMDNNIAERSTLNLSLKDHLLMQLNTVLLSESEIDAAEYLIDNVDDNGYLTITLLEAASFMNFPIVKVEKVLKVLQAFEPSGVCARNLKECLIIQLNQMDIEDENIENIINNHLDDLADNKISSIVKKTGLRREKIIEIYRFIKTLEPKPGREFYGGGQFKYIIPDVVVKKTNEYFEVYVNEDAVPNININSYYKSVLYEDINVEAKKFIQSKIDRVNWLIKCIEQRKNTLLKLSLCIVDRQNEFFKKGKKSIRPLTIEEVAGEISLHESTVARAISGKYIQCSWGVFDMKHLFPSRVPDSKMSGENIKERIKEIIISENKKFPLSDNDIMEMLFKEGVEISRRTVAKYRMEMNIPESRKRKNHSLN